MRWTEPIQPSQHQTQEVSGFLLLPMTLLCNETPDKVTRWLERATWRETYYRWFGGGGEWTATRWVDL